MEKLLLKLESALQRQIVAHEQLLALLKQKLDACRRADHARMNELMKDENKSLQEIGEIEKERLTLVAHLTQAMDPKATEPLRMGDLAEKLNEPARSRVLLLRLKLRDRMQQVQRESRVIRLASEQLLRHMQGIVQTIGGAMTGISTYGRTGTPPQNAGAVSTFTAVA